MTTSDSAAPVPPLFSPAFVQNPYPTYHRHLAGPLVQPSAVRAGVNLIFQYQACATLMRDSRLSSASRVPAFFPVDHAERLAVADLERHLRRWLLVQDPPVHSRRRKAMNAGFTPAVMERLRPRVEAVVDRLLSKLARTEAPDLIRDLAYPLPVQVISDLLGVPRALQDRCVTLSNDLATWMGDPLRTTEAARRAQVAVLELVEIIASTIAARESGADDDLMALLLGMTREDASLTTEELHAQCVMLLFAGHETTRNLIGNGLYTLLRHPAALADVRADDAAVRGAVEEVLRYESPVQGYSRGVTEDIRYDDWTLPAGTSVAFVIGAAQRDPRQISDPDRFDIHRPHNRHLAFGGDAHTCLGSTLARLEGQLAIRETVRRFPALRLVDERPDWSPTFGFRGLRTLSVTL